MKIVKFVSAVIFFVISAALTYIAYSFSGNVAAMQGTEKLSLIVVLPLLIILYIFLFGSLLSGFLAAILAIFSESKTIKLISAILSVLYVGLVGVNVALAINVFGAI